MCRFRCFLGKVCAIEKGKQRGVESNQVWEMSSRELGDIDYVVVPPPGRPGNLPARRTLEKSVDFVFRLCCVRCN